MNDRIMEPAHEPKEELMDALEPFLERLTPKQRKKFDKGMARLRKQFRNRNKFWPRLKRAIRNFH